MRVFDSRAEVIRMNNELEQKASSSQVYTRSELDGFLAQKADAGQPDFGLLI